MVYRELAEQQAPKVQLVLPAQPELTLRFLDLLGLREQAVPLAPLVPLLLLGLAVCKWRWIAKYRLLACQFSLPLQRHSLGSVPPTALMWLVLSRVQECVSPVRRPVRH